MRSAVSRLREAMNVADNTKLAEKLSVTTNTIRHLYSDRGIPDRYLVVAAERGFHPHWIKTGDGPKYLIPSHFPHFDEYPRVKVGMPSDHRAQPTSDT